ncbi:hypothetical protein, variant [Sphaeroforma arctica JP610]|uniref:SET domain-containing protein n=1 Tax=Sphaeroforma arctica JP610 TaxID=667725 RepID=A0A0L0FLA0_9EUKA|nr:hypothetical protein, variant [Sphaeroforma arctica JP610]KNC77251.1 hypothetical protein, variant [Sphaeroforma arctica JP610]|eukprot:XP_014151153.1 hypothetical protein, variant [Sphaeroforma arctica JP610]
MRPISPGDELLIFYGSHFFGLKNEFCQCATCEINTANAFDQPKQDRVQLPDHSQENTQSQPSATLHNISVNPPTNTHAQIQTQTVIDPQTRKQPSSQSSTPYDRSARESTASSTGGSVCSSESHIRHVELQARTSSNGKLAREDQCREEGFDESGVQVHITGRPEIQKPTQQSLRPRRSIRIDYRESSSTMTLSRSNSSNGSDTCVYDGVSVASHKRTDTLATSKSCRQPALARTRSMKGRASADNSDGGAEGESDASHASWIESDPDNIGTRSANTATGYAPTAKNPDDQRHNSRHGLRASANRSNSVGASSRIERLSASDRSSSADNRTDSNTNLSDEQRSSAHSKSRAAGRVQRSQVKATDQYERIVQQLMDANLIYQPERPDSEIDTSTVPGAIKRVLSTQRKLATPPLPLQRIHWVNKWMKAQPTKHVAVYVQPKCRCRSRRPKRSPEYVDEATTNFSSENNSSHAAPSNTHPARSKSIISLKGARTRYNSPSASTSAESSRTVLGSSPAGPSSGGCHCVASPERLRKSIMLKHHSNLSASHTPQQHGGNAEGGTPLMITCHATDTHQSVHKRRQLSSTWRFALLCPPPATTEQDARTYTATRYRNRTLSELEFTAFDVTAQALLPQPKLVKVMYVDDDGLAAEIRAADSGEYDISLATSRYRLETDHVEIDRIVRFELDAWPHVEYVKEKPVQLGSRTSSRTRKMTIARDMSIDVGRASRTDRNDRGRTESSHVTDMTTTEGTSDNVFRHNVTQQTPGTHSQQPTHDVRQKASNDTINTNEETGMDMDAVVTQGRKRKHTETNAVRAGAEGQFTSGRGALQGKSKGKKGYSQAQVVVSCSESASESDGEPTLPPAALSLDDSRWTRIQNRGQTQAPQHTGYGAKPRTREQTRTHGERQGVTYTEQQSHTQLQLAPHTHAQLFSYKKPSDYHSAHGGEGGRYIASVVISSSSEGSECDEGNPSSIAVNANNSPGKSRNAHDKNIDLKHMKNRLETYIDTDDKVSEAKDCSATESLFERCQAGNESVQCMHVIDLTTSSPSSSPPPAIQLTDARRKSGKGFYAACKIRQAAETLSEPHACDSDTTPPIGEAGKNAAASATGRANVLAEVRIQDVHGGVVDFNAITRTTKIEADTETETATATETETEDNKVPHISTKDGEYFVDVDARVIQSVMDGAKTGDARVPTIIGKGYPEGVSVRASMGTHDSQPCVSAPTSKMKGTCIPTSTQDSLILPKGIATKGTEIHNRDKTMELCTALSGLTPSSETFASDEDLSIKQINCMHYPGKRMEEVQSEQMEKEDSKGSENRLSFTLMRGARAC